MKAPAGGSLPPRGRWQGVALTDEGKKPLPFNQARFYSIGVPSTPAACGRHPLQAGEGRSRFDNRALRLYPPVLPVRSRGDVGIAPYAYRGSGPSKFSPQPL